MADDTAWTHVQDSRALLPCDSFLTGVSLGSSNYERVRSFLIGVSLPRRSATRTCALIGVCREDCRPATSRLLLPYVYRCSRKGLGIALIL